MMALLLEMASVPINNPSTKVVKQGYKCAARSSDK